MKMKPYWWLGFLALIGVYKLPQVIAYFEHGGSAWTLVSLLWFFWLLEFIPVRQRDSEAA
ncbi:hypothetical protein [Marinobacter adhaerens]|uniref:hypothetical protein n=1 Tax=Marinobacter adhaerens TaxID=1033846 RepID=UPI001C59B308|nr:hypothetical protein [Marinobacter adhaerens]MBW3227221.1 hypothetical protein [Marinobacter adhaerens]